MRNWVAAFVMGGVAVGGCAGPVGVAGGGGAGGEDTMTGSSSSGAVTGGGGAPQATGLPCDVATLLQTHCWSCHGSPPSGGAPNALITHADLAAPSNKDPSQTNAARSLARMQDAASPMPPKPTAPVPAAEIAAFQAWIASGLPMGSCGGSSSSSGSSSGGPYDTPLMCSSNTYWTGGDSGSANMHPGKACKSCHVVLGKATKKTFDISGTVYATAHEPDDCNGTSVAGAKVVITDANGQEHALDVNGVGNFEHSDLFGFAPFPVPYQAKVIYNGKERAMNAAQTNGDCNACHTQDGASNAPGRIMLP